MESGLQAVVLAAEFQRRLEEAFLAAAVVADAFILESEDSACAHKRGDPVCQLDFASDARLCAAQVFEDFGFQNVAAYTAKSEGALSGAGFSTMPRTRVLRSLIASPVMMP